MASPWDGPPVAGWDGFSEMGASAGAGRRCRAQPSDETGEVVVGIELDLEMARAAASRRDPHFGAEGAAEIRFHSRDVGVRARRLRGRLLGAPRRRSLRLADRQVAMDDLARE